MKQPGSFPDQELYSARSRSGICSGSCVCVARDKTTVVPEFTQTRCFSEKQPVAESNSCPFRRSKLQKSSDTFWYPTSLGIAFLDVKASDARPFRLAGPVVCCNHTNFQPRRPHSWALTSRVKLLSNVATEVGARVNIILPTQPGCS